MKLFLITLAGCLLAGAVAAQRQMPISESLRTHSDKYEVTVRGKGQLTPYTFGEFRLAYSKEKWNTETESWWVWRPGELSHETEVAYIRDRYNFLMTHPSGDTASVVCLFRLPGSTTQVRGSAVQDIMTAHIRTNRDTAAWQLVMGAVAVNGRGTKFELADGILFNAGEEYAVVVHTTWSDGKKPLLGPIGFEIFSGEESVAALQVGGFTRGMVWISTAVEGPRRHLLSAAVETLLMWVHNGGYEAKTYDYDRD